MTNGEMIRNYNGLAAMQEKEQRYREDTGENLFKGRMKIVYAIKKNMEEILGKLKPYNAARDDLFAEYRDLEAEQAAFEEARNRGESGDGVEMIFREGKNREEYARKLTDLLDLEIDDLYIYKISLDDLEGIALDSMELEPFMFMIE